MSAVASSSCRLHGVPLRQLVWLLLLSSWLVNQVKLLPASATTTVDMAAASSIATSGRSSSSSSLSSLARQLASSMGSSLSMSGPRWQGALHWPHQAASPTTTTTTEDDAAVSRPCSEPGHDWSERAHACAPCAPGSYRPIGGSGSSGCIPCGAGSDPTVDRAGCVCAHPDEAWIAHSNSCEPIDESISRLQCSEGCKACEESRGHSDKKDGSSSNCAMSATTAASTTTTTAPDIHGVATLTLPPPSPRRECKCPAARINDEAHSALYDDFTRVVWVPASVNVTSFTLGLRAFFSATSFLQPGVRVRDLLRYAGNFFHPARDMAVMRCKPAPGAQRRAVQSILATWPNVFPAIAADLAPCSAQTDEVLRRLCFLASTYVDTPSDVYDVGLAATLTHGAEMFSTPGQIDALNAKWGIFTAFTGLGYTVANSANETGAIRSFTTRQVLRESIVPEYLLKNAPLAQANCRCLRLSATLGQEAILNQRYEPDFLWAHGQLTEGTCTPANTLSDR